MDHLEDVTDRREFGETRLANGVRCIFIHDPEMENVGVGLVIKGGMLDEPEGLRGLMGLSKLALLRGSARYPDAESFQNILLKNELKRKSMTGLEDTFRAVEVPVNCLEEYLDRLSDSLCNLHITEDELESEKADYVTFIHKVMNDSNLRQLHVLNYLLYGFMIQERRLLNRKDLLNQVQDCVDHFSIPSNTTFYLMGNISINDMKELSIRYFGRLAQEPNMLPKPRQSSWIDLDFTNKLRIKNHAILARVHTKSSEKKIMVSSRLPRYLDVWSPLYVSYLFNTSQSGSLQFKLKKEGLITSSYMNTLIYTVEFQTLDLQLSLTEKGSRSVPTIFGYFLGYADILKEMRPNYELYKQAQEYFKSDRKCEDCLGSLDRMSCDLYVGLGIDDLRYSGVPTHFIPTNIDRITNSMTSENIIIVATSNEYVDTPVHIETDFFLQFSIENITIEPCFDGLMVPRPDPLIISSRQPVIVTSSMHKLFEQPLVYVQSVAGEFHSYLTIGIKSPALAYSSPPAQRLYAAMINHKMSLRSMKNIVESSVTLVGGSLEITFKSIPDSLPLVVTMLVEYLSSPIGEEQQGFFLEMKRKEENMMDLWLAGDLQIEYDNYFESILRSDVKIFTQREQLSQIMTADDLPRQLKGDVVAFCKGKPTWDSLTVIAFQLQKLYEPVSMEALGSTSDKDISVKGYI